MNLTFALFVYLLGIVWKQQRHRSKSANISLVHLTLPPSTEPERLNPLEVKLDLVPFPLNAKGNDDKRDIWLILALVF